jgi:hypothetical protein
MTKPVPELRYAKYQWLTVYRSLNQELQLNVVSTSCHWPLECYAGSRVEYMACNNSVIEFFSIMTASSSVGGSIVITIPVAIIVDLVTP